jgi:hypothetical protein
MQSVFPEALQSLREADPEVFGIIEDEKKRQWYVLTWPDPPGCVEVYISLDNHTLARAIILAHHLVIPITSYHAR